MSGNKYVYRCSECDSTVEVSGEANSPMCCKKVMVKDPLDPCTTADHAEMVRNADDGDACDDGRDHVVEPE